MAGARLALAAIAVAGLLACDETSRAALELPGGHAKPSRCASGGEASGPGGAMGPAAPDEPARGDAASPRRADAAAEGQGCAPPSGADPEALLALLPRGDYACVETIAAALAPRADAELLGRLLALAADGREGWSRRNALRVILRFGLAPDGSAARDLVRAEAGRIGAAVLARLSADRCPDVLADAICILDACLYPCAAAQAAFEAISGDAAFPASLRFRAIAAVGRLLWAAPSLSDGDVQFLARSLASDERWVRAEAAYLARTPAAERASDAQAAALCTALDDAYARESDVVAKAYAAQALDCYQGSALYPQLRERWEAAHLPNTRADDGAAVRSALPPRDLDAILATAAAERRAFLVTMGAPFDEPVPGDPNPTVTLVVCADEAEYDDYMDAFVHEGAGAGGLYVERAGTLYTFDRPPQTSRFTLGELLQHEYAHALQARYVYPGVWGDPGYAAEPKGWADEGLAELFAGFVFEGDGFGAPPRAVHLAALCGAPPRPLAELLAERAGYDEPGEFDYANGWAFAYYLHERCADARSRLYRALRDGSYRLVDFADLAGVASVAALDESWHASLRALCAARADGRAAALRNGAPSPASPGRDAVVRVGRAPPQDAAPHPQRAMGL